MRDSVLVLYHGKIGWRERCLEACQHNQSKFGTILMAAFLCDPISPPRFAFKAWETSDGFVTCDFTRLNGEHRHGAFVGSTEDLWSNVDALARVIGLSEQEHDSLRSSVAGWLGRDETGQHVRRNREIMSKP